MSSATTTRPIGITILAILAFATAAYAGYMGAMIISGGAAFAGLPLVGGLFAGLLFAIAGVVLFIALIWALIGWGFLAGKGWARTIGLLFAFLALIFGLLSVAGGSFEAIITLLTGGLTIFYLFTGPVKAYFGGASSGSPGYSASPSTPRPSIPTATFGSSSFSSSPGKFSASSGAIGRTCNSCGAPVGSGLTKCPNCGSSI